MREVLCIVRTILVVPVDKHGLKWQGPAAISHAVHAYFGFLGKNYSHEKRRRQTELCWSLCLLLDDFLLHVLYEEDLAERSHDPIRC